MTNRSYAVLASLCFSSLVSAATAPTTATPAAKPKNTVVTDSWYTMQSNSTPWGYYHERVEMRDGRYTYRYEMLKKEKDEAYEENIGAIAEADLTPVAFNLNKNGGGVIETIDGSFKKGTHANTMKVSIHGARNMAFERAIPKNGILEAFFPIWISQNWDTLKKKPKGSLNVFAENPNTGDFNSRSIYYQYKGPNPSKKCHEIQAEMDGITSVWCLEDSGTTKSISFNGGQVAVERVSGEAEAKKFIKITPKKGK